MSESCSQERLASRAARSTAQYYAGLGTPIDSENRNRNWGVGLR